MIISNKKNNDLSFYDTFKFKISLILSTTIFFYVFIIFFLPFGVSNYNPNHQYTFDFLLEIFYFFIIILVFSLFNELVIRPLIFKKATLIKIILWSAWSLYFLSSVVFFTYNALGNWHDLKLASYFEFLIQVSVVLSFPLVATYFVFRYKTLQQQIEYILTTKKAFIDSNQLIAFKGQGSNDQITLSLTNFLYGKSQDNYVELYYIEKEQIKKFLMRTTLSNLCEFVNNSIIVRCHRSYIVNLLLVKSVKGKSQDMTLTLDPFDSSIPISKSYQKSTLENLHKIKNFV